MIRLLQNSPTTFQTDDLKTIYNISGKFSIDNDNYLTIDNNIINIKDEIYTFYRDSNHIGGSIWLSSIAMILYIQKNNKKNFENKKILELGAGIALPSIFLSKISEKIVSSDFDISITNVNIQKNNCNNIDVKQIIWSELDEEIIGNEKYDIIIASDCIYRNTYKILLNTIKKFMKQNGKLIISNAYRESLDDFIYGLLEIDSNVKIIEQKLYYNDIYYIDLFIIENI